MNGKLVAYCKAQGFLVLFTFKSISPVACYKMKFSFMYDAIMYIYVCILICVCQLCALHL